MTGVDGADTFDCGGTLVSPQWVLTAGHCATSINANQPLSPGVFTVRLGSHTFDSGTPSGVDQVALSPAWDGRTLSGDAALLHLTNAAPEAPLALYAGSPPAGTPARTIGWGLTEEGGPSPSPTLREVDVPILDDSACLNGYGSDYLPATMMCAGYLSGGKDACNGDSGGPLMAPTQDAARPWVDVGIVSWGIGCAEAGFPGIYTRLANADIRSWAQTTAAAQVVDVALVPPVTTPVPTPTVTATPTPTPIPIVRVQLPSRCRAGRCAIAASLPAGGSMQARLTITRRTAHRLGLHRRTLAEAVRIFNHPFLGTVLVKVTNATRSKLRGKVHAKLLVITAAGRRTRSVVLTRR